MPNKYELFRSSLSVPMFENINQSLFKLLQTPEYQRYTDIVFSTLGQELERYFGKDMIFKYRYKSQKSFTNNVLKDSTLDTNDDRQASFVSRFNPYIHYDIIGMRLVIKNISNDFSVSHQFIKNCKFEKSNLAIFQIENTLYKYIKLSLLI